MSLTKCTRVVIADPYPVVRNGLSKVLDSEPDFEIVADCPDSTSCIKAIREFLPDIAIVDVWLPEILAVISSEGLPARIVLFTELEKQKPGRLYALGVDAVVRKDADPQDLLQTLQQVASSTRRAESGRPGGDAKKAIKALTDREREIMRLVSEGLSNKEIGCRLKVTDGTIKVHLNHIFQKLVIGNRTALAALYLNHASGN